VSEAQIERVVARFYAAVRGHPVLGAVFGVHVTDWPEHEEKIGRFWRNALLLQRQYDGNPMQTHRAAGNVKAEHFTIWLGLFDQTLETELPPELAQAWSAIAHTIGRGLRYGLQQGQSEGEVPTF